MTMSNKLITRMEETKTVSPPKTSKKTYLDDELNKFSSEKQAKKSLDHITKYLRATHHKGNQP